MRPTLLIAIVQILILNACTSDTTKEAKVLTEKRDKAFDVSISELQFPVDFALNELEKLVNSAIPTTLINDKLAMNEKGDSVMLIVQKRGKIALSSQGNRLYSAVPLHVSAVLDKNFLGLSLKNKKPIEFSLIMHMVSDLRINDNWDLEATCIIQDIKWIKKPTLKVLLANVKLDKIIENQLDKNHTKLESLVCELLQEVVPIRKQVDKVWQLMITPQIVARNPVKIWLNSQPSYFASAFDKSIKDTLRVNILAKSQIIVATVALPAVATKLLPSNAGKVNSNNKLNVQAALTIPYSAIEKYIFEQIGGKIFSYQGLSIRVTAVSCMTVDQKVLISIKVDGDAKGSIEASGFPTLDSELNLIITDFQYQIKSQNVILNAADWVVNSSLSTYISQIAKLPLRTLLDSLDDKIASALNDSKTGAKARLNIDFSSIELDTLLLRNKEIVWFFDIQGKARFQLKSELVPK